MRLLTIVLIVTAFFALQSADEGPSGLPLAFDGFTEAYKFVNLSASVDGILESVTVARGDTVKKGQVLATLESEVRVRGGESYSAPHDSPFGAEGRFERAGSAASVQPQ